MITTKFWHERPITFDEDKYIVEVTYPISKLLLIDKESYTLISKVSCPGFILQTGEYEFVTADMIKPDTYRFQHLSYSKEKSKTEVLFSKDYTPRSNITGSIKIINDVFIITSWLETTLYNSTTRKSLTLKNSKIQSLSDTKESLDQNEYYNPDDYLIAKIKVEPTDYTYNYDIKMTDYLISKINKKSLEFDEFYSTEQDRIIPINTEAEHSSFESRFHKTVEEEVIKYLELLSKKEDYYQDYITKKAKKRLLKK